MSGDESLSAIAFDKLQSAYGAFGHTIEENTSPIDLDAALKSPVFKDYLVELIEGEDLTRSYDPGIPEGAIT